MLRLVSSTIHTAMYLSLERFRLCFQYLYRYLNLSFSQSDVPDLLDWPIKLFKNREKVAIVVEEVKSEPLYYHQDVKEVGI